MKKFKKALAILGVAIMSLSVVGCSSSNTTTLTAEEQAKIEVAKVDGQVITLKDVEDKMAQVKQMMVAQYGEDYRDNEEAMNIYKAQQKGVLDYLTETKLIEADAKNLGLEATEEEIQEEVDFAKSQFQTEAELEEYLKSVGHTMDSYKAYAKEMITVGKVIQNITKDVTVADDEVKKQYDENQSMYTTKPGANMYHILVATEEEAKKVKEEYDAGTDFAELAAKYGTDGTKTQGGSLGFVEYESPNYDKDFLAGAKTLAEGEVSAPVKTQFGYHLIKVTDIEKEEKVMDFETVQANIKGQLLQEKQYTVFNDYIDGLKEKATIEIFEDKLG